MIIDDHVVIVVLWLKDSRRMNRRNRVSKLRGKRDSLQVEITHCCQRENVIVVII